MDSSTEVLERAKVREVAGVFYSRRAIEAAIDDLLLNGFDRADIDRLASLDEVRRRLKVYVSAEELADLARAPRQPVFTRDDITGAFVCTVTVIGAVLGTIVVLLVLSAGGSGTAAWTLGVLCGLAAGGIAGLLLARAFRRDDQRGLEGLEFARGVVLWVSVHSAEREAMAQEILRRHGGRAVRVHEIVIEKLPGDLPLSSLRPDPWLGSEPLGRLQQ